MTTIVSPVLGATRTAHRGVRAPSLSSLCVGIFAFSRMYRPCWKES
jgi:hypothetical protein